MKSATSTDTTNEWVAVDPDIAKRIGLIGAGDVRYRNDCVYVRHMEGSGYFGWFELQVPKLPHYEPTNVEDEPLYGKPRKEPA